MCMSHQSFYDRRIPFRVLDTTNTVGKRLFDVLQNKLNLFDIDINNVYGQSYDNESNMKGKHQ